MLVEEVEDVLLAEAVLFPLAEVLFLSLLSLTVLFPAWVGCALPPLVLLSPLECVSETDDGASAPDPDSEIDSDGEGEGEGEGEGRVRLRS